MRHIKLAIGTAALLFSTTPLIAREGIDLSGTWQMDASRSESAHQAVPIGPITLVIRQTASELIVETRRSEKGSSVVNTETLTFKLNGVESSAVGNYGALVKLKAHWDGPRLMTETVRNVQDATVSTMQVFSLDASGQEMTVDKTLTIQHGYQSPGASNNNVGKGRDVFVRGRPSTKR